MKTLSELETALREMRSRLVKAEDDYWEKSQAIAGWAKVQLFGDDSAIVAGYGKAFIGFAKNKKPLGTIGWDGSDIISLKEPVKIQRDTKAHDDFCKELKGRNTTLWSASKKVCDGIAVDFMKAIGLSTETYEACYYKGDINVYRNKELGGDEVLSVSNKTTAEDIQKAIYNS